MKKICACCKKEKHNDEFHRNKQSKDGRYCYCKSCCKIKSKNLPEKSKQKYRDRSRKWAKDNPERVLLNDRRKQLRKKYGITLEDYNRMLDMQDGKCRICGKPAEESSTRGNLSVDHCHKTGKVRALLCINCNAGLGNFMDNPDLLSKALNYLREQRHE